MNIKLIHTTLLTLCALLTACSDDDMSLTTNHDGKTPIELSVGGIEGLEQTSTRAVITNGTGNKKFTKDTHIFMLMMSEYVSLGDGYSSLNYGGAHDAKYTTTRGKIKEASGGTGTVVEFDNDGSNTRTRYWDDAHARSSKLSIWAVACDGSDKLGGNGTELTETSNIFNNATSLASWQTTTINANSLAWNVPTAQTEASMKNRDLLFSNNVTNYTINSTTTDNRTSFNPSTKKFGTSDLVFYHAMSKITINIKKDESFADGEFKFPENKNIQLNYFNVSGSFNVENGEFSEVNKPSDSEDGHTPINTMYSRTPSGSGNTYELDALVLPYLSTDSKTYQGSQFTKDNPNVMMEFTINNNTYKLTAAQLFNALHVDGDPSKALVTNATTLTDNSNVIPLEAGKHYVFTFNVGKTKIENISAQIVDWEEVNTQLTPSGARIKLKLEERGDALADDVVAIYRAADDASTITDTHVSYKWNTGYTGSDNKNTYKNDNGKWKLTTDWYWTNSMNYYHFRAVMPSSTSVTNQAAVDSKPAYDYISLTSSSTYTDIRWGAPMRDNADDETPGSFKWTYDKDNGFAVDNDNLGDNKKQIYQAIGPTENTIKLTLFHMMSELNFKIKTSDGNDKVELYKSGNPEGTQRTKVQLVGYLPSGRLWMGNGLVVADGTMTDKNVAGITCNTTATEQYGQQEYTYGAIPQDLTNVKLYITTPDNNQYIVDLAKAKATTVTSTNLANPYTQSGGKYTIDRWYPGFKYNYTFTLKKSGITDITATVVNWETVTADNEDVTIK